VKHLDLDAVDRIMAAVNVPGRAPDRKELLADLEGELAIYRTGTVLRERPVEREQMVAKAVAALECGRGLLGDYIDKYGMLHLRCHLAPLDRVLEDVRKENSAELNRIVGFKQPMTVSAVERLVGGLVRIFERHYKIEAGYTDDYVESSSSSPFIDFADAVLQEAGINYDRRSIPRTMRKRP
jgi:hypothetical protein